MNAVPLCATGNARVLTLGLNHGSAPLDLRGRFVMPAPQLAPGLQALRQRLADAGPELAILSTCNRTELYLALPNARARAANDAQALVAPALAWLATQGGVPTEQLQPHTYVRSEGDAARHAFRVATGLDSMVLGETQILGQMKRAVKLAEEAGTLGSTLHQLFQRAFAVAKQVRGSTEIGMHSVSVAAAAVRLVGEVFEDWAPLKVLFVGAGEMIDLMAAHVAARSPAVMAVANRSAERGEALCQRLGAQALTLSELPQRLHEFDVVISCTASQLPLIGLGAVQRALQRRRRRPMLMFDLAVPRDIEAEVAGLDDAYLYTLDDLAQQTRAAVALRRAAVDRAEAIIDVGVDHFGQWLDHRASVPLIQAVQRQADGWRDAELARARRALARGEDVDAVLSQLATGLSRKLLHGAFSELQHSVGEAHARCAESVSRVFLRPAHRGERH